jgi:hypothetical protein
MSANRAHLSNSSAVAERLLAHARLCEQVALGCGDADTAQELKRMARECARTAAQVAPGRDTAAHTKH